MAFLDIALIIQIFVLLNPFASFPFLISAYEKKMHVTLIAVRAVLVGLALAMLIVLIGPFLFDIFGISLDSFRTAGGIVLLLLGISMVRPQQEEKRKKNHTRNSIITLIATPLLTGPATISFITIKAFEIGKVHVLVSLCIAFLLVGVLLLLFSFMIPHVNVTVVDILSRVMGLFLTAVAIEMIAKGVEGLLASMA